MEVQARSNRKRIEELLFSYKGYKEELKELQKEIGCIDDECGVSGISYEGIGGSNGLSDITYETAIRKLARKERVAEKIIKVLDKIELIEGMLGCLGKKEREVITLYYIENLTWQQVAERVGYSEVHCRRIRCKAIERVLKKCSTFQ